MSLRRKRSSLGPIAWLILGHEYVVRERVTAYDPAAEPSDYSVLVTLNGKPLRVNKVRYRSL